MPGTFALGALLRKKARHHHAAHVRADAVSALPYPQHRSLAQSAPVAASCRLVRIAGLSGASSVALAAYGAHALKVDGDPQRKVAFENANKSHMVNSVALALCPTLKRPAVSGGLFVAGTLIFSGSCYAYALSGDRKFSKLAPIGGFTMIGAWLSLVV